MTPTHRASTLLALIALVAAPPSLAGQSPDPAPPDAAGEGDRGAWHHISGFPVEFASDAWATVAAPFRVRGTDAWALLGVVGTTGILYAYDLEIQNEVRRSNDGALAEGVLEVADFVEPVSLMGNTNAFYLGGFLLGSLTGWDRVRLISQELVFSHWIAGGLRKGIGRPIGRRRPFKEPNDPYVFESGGSSFPSGHASTAMQVAAVLSHHIDWWPATVGLYGLAGTIVYQRVASDQHWASDTFLGAAWGWGVSQVVIRRREAGKRDWVPLFDSRTGSMGVSVPVRGF